MKQFLKAWNKYINKDLIKEQFNTNLQSATGVTPADNSEQQTRTAEIEAEKAAMAVEKEKKLKIATLDKEIKGLEATVKNKKLEMTRLKDELSKLEETTGFQGEQEGSIGNIPVSSEEQLLPLKESELTEDMCGDYEGIDEDGQTCNIELMYEDRECGCSEELEEAKYKGRSVPLNKPMKGDVKKFKVYVKNPSTGNIKKVNFGDKTMRIKKSNPARRKSFRARHRCDNPGPKTKARYWSCRKW